MLAVSTLAVLACLAALLAAGAWVKVNRVASRNADGLNANEVIGQAAVLTALALGLAAIAVLLLLWVVGL